MLEKNDEKTKETAAGFPDKNTKFKVNGKSKLYWTGFKYIEDK